MSGRLCACKIKSEDNQHINGNKKLMVGLDGHWLTFPFPFVHHQPLHIFYLSSSFLFHVYLQRKRKINIRRNKKEEGEDRRLPTVETRTSGRLVVM